METELPPDFSGLIYQPRIETSIYFLLGMLRHKLPYRFAYEEFEVKPYNYPHKKTLDIKGKVWRSGKWEDVTFELKVYSSGLMEDIKRNPDFDLNLHFDYLICWIDDEPEAKKYCEEVIVLKDIYDALPPNEQKDIIFDAETDVKGTSKKTITELITMFTKNKEKVIFILDNIKHQKVGGQTEILIGGGRTIFRIGPYKNEHITVSRYPRGKGKEFFIKQFRAEKIIRKGEESDQVNIYLDGMSRGKVEEFVEIFNNF